MTIAQLPKFVEEGTINFDKEVKKTVKRVASYYVPKYLQEEDPIVIPVKKIAQRAPDIWEYGQTFAPGEEPKQIRKIPISPQVWEEIEVSIGEPIPPFAFPEKLTLRQRIHLAAAHSMMINLTYVKAYDTGSGEEGMLKSYNLEPYAYRRRVSKTRGGRREYFFGYDTEDGTIKSFLVSGMKDVDILPYDKYSPRWVVEV